MGATVCFLIAFVLPSLYFLKLAPIRRLMLTLTVALALTLIVSHRHHQPYLAIMILFMYCTQKQQMEPSTTRDG